MELKLADRMTSTGYTLQQFLLLQALERQATTGMLMTNPRVTGFTSFAKAVLNFIDDKKAPKTCKNLYNYLVANGYYVDIHSERNNRKV
jgi:DNA polymerase III gamma/tau subunit